MGTVVTVSGSGRSTPAYLAEPAGSGPGVMVVPGEPGFGPDLLAQCHALAAAGYVALGVDVHSGPSGADDAGSVRRPPEAVRVRRTATMLAAGARQLRAHPMVRPERVGVLGHATGGSLALLAAAIGGIDAVVGYGDVVPPPQVPARCPVLLHPTPAGPDGRAAWAATTAFLGEHLRGRVPELVGAGMSRVA